MKEKEQALDLTQGKVSSQLVKFFLPVAAGMVIQQLYNAVDALIVGRYVGTAALAACGGSPAMVINLVIGLLVSLTGGASVVVAHYYGENNEDGIKKASGSAIAGCTVLGLAITVLGIWLSPAILRAMKTPEDTMADASLYLRLLFGATVFVIIYNMGAGILRASGDSKRPFWYLFACCIANIFMDWLFVAKFGWGVSGAGIATAAAQIISCVLVLARMATADEAYRINLTHIKWDSLSLKRMLRIGVTSALQSCMYSVSNSVVQIGINTLGTASVAAWCLCSKIDGFYWALMTAMGTAVMTFAGQNYGASRMDRVRESAKQGLLISFIGTVVMSGAIIFAAPHLLPLFDDDPEVVRLTMVVFYCIVPLYILWPSIEIFSGILKGVGDAIVPVIILGITICLYRIVWVYTGFALVPTLKMLCYCYPISWALANIPLYTRYRKTIGK